MIACEVLTEQIVVEGGTHQHNTNFRVFAEHMHNCQQDEVSVNVTFVYLVEHDERKVCEELTTRVD